MAKSRLLKNLKKDEEDEDEAIEIYDEREDELEDEDEPKMKSKIREIKEDEESHKSTIHKMRKGIGPSDSNFIKKAMKDKKGKHKSMFKKKK